MVTTTNLVSSVYQLARLIAANRRRNAIFTEELLLAILSVNGTGRQVLERNGIEISLLTETIECSSLENAGPYYGDRLRVSPRHSVALELAHLEAIRAGRDELATIDLLIGLILEETGIAAQTLTKFGVTKGGLMKEAAKLSTDDFLSEASILYVPS